MYIFNGQASPSPLMPVEFLSAAGSLANRRQVVLRKGWGVGGGNALSLRGALELALGETQGVWQAVAERFDVRRLSTEELETAAGELYSGGAISAHDYLLLVASGFHAAPDVRWLTGVDDDGRLDWVAEYEARLAQDAGNGPKGAFEEKARVLGHLARLDAVNQTFRSPSLPW
ncbi:MAG: hypothetical protein HQL51_06240 [Magnetococcales bacterium]|nr:hypothetical protein [Magnetococcales bacterium]